ncbi:hypothetical protein ONZ45_g9452 [Pleurotus djamor]|nr:hypothetical protein ONZ45_g9452 [Pleurotus djamor]
MGEAQRYYPAARAESQNPEARAPTFEVKAIHIRPLLSVMKEASQGPEFQDLHLMPFEQCWDPEYVHDPAAPSSQHHGYPVRKPFSEVPQGHQRLYAKVYNTQKMMDTCSLPVLPTLETVVVAFMFWSDSTHLANFGTASLWPLHTFFGN